jgi:hypothetical protein
MWTLSRVKRSTEQCRSIDDALENALNTSALSSSERAHLSGCRECQSAAEGVAFTREALQDMSRPVAQAGPWFAPRVMAAIAARESELRQSFEAWAAVPRLAARLTWLSALALLVASTFLYEMPKSSPKSNSEAVAESLFDSPQASATQDDVVLPLGKAQ